MRNEGTLTTFFLSAKWWNSPYINHFLQPDTIVPDYVNPQSWNRYSYVINNPLRFTDPTGHMMSEGDGGGCGKKCKTYIEQQKNKSKKKKEDDDGSITDLILQLPGSAKDWNTLATGLDVLAWSTDVYAAGAVTYAFFGGAALPAPLIAAGLPEVPLATGLAGMAIAELYVQPVLFIGNTLATLSTSATIVSDTKAGNTRIEEANFSIGVLNSMALTDIGWKSNEAFLSLAIQSVAVSNDFQWTSWPFPPELPYP